MPSHSEPFTSSAALGGIHPWWSLPIRHGTCGTCQTQFHLRLSAFWPRTTICVFIVSILLHYQKTKSTIITKLKCEQINEVPMTQPMTKRICPSCAVMNSIKTASTDIRWRLTCARVRQIFTWIMRERTVIDQSVNACLHRVLNIFCSQIYHFVVSCFLALENIQR